MNKPTNRISICNKCLDLLPALSSIIRNTDGVRIRNEFGGSICQNHAHEMANAAFVSPEEKKQWLDKLDKYMNDNWPPDLREHPELVKAYQDMFTTTLQGKTTMDTNKPDDRLKICSNCINLFPELHSIFQGKRIDNDFMECMCLNHFKEGLVHFPPAKRKPFFDRIDKRMNHD